MKKLFFVFVIALTSMMVGENVYAASQVKVEDSIKKIATEYENVPGVDCMMISQGEGLGLFKVLLNKQFGKKFMKDVTSVVIIDYSAASAEVVAELRAKVASFNGVLQEFDLGEDELAEGEYVKCLAKVLSDVVISDFLINMEDAESKMLLYMGGELNIENMDLDL